MNYFGGRDRQIHNGLSQYTMGGELARCEKAKKGWQLHSLEMKEPHAIETATFHFGRPGHKRQVLQFEDLKDNEDAIRAVGQFCPAHEEDIRTKLNKMEQGRALATAYFHWHPDRNGRKILKNLIQGIRDKNPNWGDQLVQLDSISAFQRRSGWQIETLEHLESAVLDWYTARRQPLGCAYWCIVYSQMQGRPFFINHRYVGVLLDWRFDETMVCFALAEPVMRIYEGPKDKLGKFESLSAVALDECL
ncbi:hypothetical protein AJ80_08802 [Polytolypa hystricis UAMH7299]|uniref:Uncharacterized protein n=1 Tax=Polytolypa hystricis (strain UAMH7299) TaxID=1447883 RepID=A0A2B7X278_POLH7|nr:hypothetical protein AJ80_08802 [Polytolypa hystricis UAMH7299]